MTRSPAPQSGEGGGVIEPKVAPVMRGRLSFDRRIVLLSVLAGSPAFLFAMVLLWAGEAATQTKGLQPPPDW